MDELGFKIRKAKCILTLRVLFHSFIHARLRRFLGPALHPELKD
jgi:hypothetical protein